MSKTCFCSIFHSVVGMPFKEYLNRYRIEKAAELIASGEKASVAGSSCGYGDASTFYRNFKKIYGNVTLRVCKNKGQLTGKVRENIPTLLP